METQQVKEFLDSLNAEELMEIRVYIDKLIDEKAEAALSAGDEPA